MTDEEKITSLFEAYEAAFRNKDAEGCGNCYAQDAEYIACGMAAIRGRTGITSLHREILEADCTLDSMVTDEIRVSGNLAYVRQTLKISGATTLVMIVMQRDTKGPWLVSAEAEVATA